MTEFDFSDVEWDDDEGGEETPQGFSTIKEQNDAVNQPAATQQATTVHVDPEPVTYKDTTDPQKKKEMFLASKGIPGPHSRAMREGKWDKYLINPKTGNPVFSEYEARQASRGGWSVPIDAEGVRELAESIRNDVPEVGEELASLVMNDPQKARKAIANGNLSQAQAKRAYELMDKVYAYNKTKQWLEGAEDFSQTYPMRQEVPSESAAPVPKKENDVPSYNEDNIFAGYEYLTDFMNGQRIPKKMREKAISAVDSTIGAALRMNSKRGISDDIGKWDKNTRRMMDNALEDLRRQATKSKSGKIAYQLANRLINTKYVEARLKRFIGNYNSVFRSAEAVLGKARIQDIAYKTLVGRKSARKIIYDFGQAKQGVSGHDSELRDAINEQKAIANGERMPKKRKKRTTPITSGKPKDKGTEELTAPPAPTPAPAPAPTPAKPKTFGNMLKDNMTEVDEILSLMSMYKNNPYPFKPRWDKILTVLKREGINIPKKLTYDSIVDLGGKTGWDIDRMSEIIEKVKV